MEVTVRRLSQGLGLFEPLYQQQFRSERRLCDSELLTCSSVETSWSECVLCRATGCCFVLVGTFRLTFVLRLKKRQTTQTIVCHVNARFLQFTTRSSEFQIK